MRHLSTTSRFVKLDLTLNNFLASPRDILVIEKSNAGLESEDLGLFDGGGVLGLRLERAL